MTLFCPHPAIHPLEALFHPSSVAIIGAKEEIDSVGRTLIANLLQPGLSRKIYLINPQHDYVLGLPCLPNIAAVGHPVDLAIIATPPATVPQLVAECAAANVKTLIILTAGIKESKIEDELITAVQKARQDSDMRILGPNCLGVMCPLASLNATFAPQMAKDGHIAFISQSGAMCTAVLDWSLKKQFGFSGFVSIGAMIDINWADLLDYFGKDPSTHSILIYMESIGNARDFLAIAKRVAQRKPIILIKAGKSDSAAEAAASHTGALTGNDRVFDIAMRRVGILRVESIGELFDMALVLAKQPAPQGPCLTIITNAGGPGVLATDAAVLCGAKMTQLSKEVTQQLSQFLPQSWSHSNPIDLVGDAPPERFLEALKIIAHDNATDALLVILTLQSVTKPKKIAEILVEFSQNYHKPIFASWMGGKNVEEAIHILQTHQIPTFAFPDNAARLFAKMWRQKAGLEALKENFYTPLREEVHLQKKQTALAAHTFLASILEQGRTLLTEQESKHLFSLYNLPVVRTEIASHPEEAIQLAAKIGYPVVLKLNSRLIAHKSDQGGVILDIKTPEDVEEAWNEIKSRFTKEEFQGVSVQPMIEKDGYELILGSSLDREFGPVMLFGMGGQLVEILEDTAIALPPLNSRSAQELLEKTRISKAFHGIRGRPAIKEEELISTLVKFSELIAEQPLIKECDINPLLATANGLLVLDARVLLAPSEQNRCQLVIRPYPEEYKQVYLNCTIRPIQMGDIDSIKDFLSHHNTWSSQIPEAEWLCACNDDYSLTFIAEDPMHAAPIALFSIERLYGTKDAFFWLFSSVETFTFIQQLLNHAQTIAIKEGLQSLKMFVNTEDPLWEHFKNHYTFSGHVTDEELYELVTLPLHEKNLQASCTI